MLSTMEKDPLIPTIDRRFRGFLPVVVDVETAGFNAKTDALLEIAAIVIDMDEQGFVHPGMTVDCHVEPFEGANLDPKALDFTGIDPTTLSLRQAGKRCTGGRLQTHTPGSDNA